MLFVDANKMVSAPFPRSHENGLPGNHHLREATKMTMLWMSEKWCSKKRPPPQPQRVSAFSFLVFFLHLHLYLIYIYKANESKTKQTKAKVKQNKTMLLFALLWFLFAVPVEITAFQAFCLK